MSTFSLGFLNRSYMSRHRCLLCAVQPPPSPNVTPYVGDLATPKPVKGNQTPTGKEPKPRSGMDTKRKQTLLSLLDILAELQKDGEASLSGAYDLAVQSKVALVTTIFADLQPQIKSEKLEERQYGLQALICREN